MPRPEITEWASIFAGYQHGILGGNAFFFFLGLVAIAVFLAWLTRWREITPALILLFTLYLGVMHNRHRVFFVITFGAYMPALLTTYFQELSTRPGFMAWVHRLGRGIPALMVILLTGFYAYGFVGVNPFDLEVPSEPSLASKNDPHYPLGASAYIEQRQLSGKIVGHVQLGRILPLEIISSMPRGY
jgi:hypothetical protein